MKVTIGDITQIKAGKARAFACDTPLEAKSGQSLVSYVKKFRREDMQPGVVNYETTIENNILTVVAIAER